MGGPDRTKVIVVLLLVQVLFAVHYLATKVLLASVGPAAWATVRILSAAAIFLVVYAIGWRRPIAGRDLLRLAAFSLFGVVVNQICFIEGLARTTPSHSALIMTTIPVATTFFAVVFGREQLRRPVVLGIVLAMTGVLVLLRVDDLELRAEWFLGDVLTQINAASFGLFLVISKGLVQRLGPVPATAGVLCFGSMGAALYGAPATARLDPVSIPGSVWLLAAFIVIFPTVIAYFLNFWALARVRSSQVAMFIYLQPILASTLSVMFLGEVITGRLVVSSAFVFLGVLLATRELGEDARSTAGAAEGIEAV